MPFRISRAGAIAALTAALLWQAAQPVTAQSPAPSLEQAQAFMQQHDYKHAIEVLDALAKTDPKNARIFVTRGDAKDYLGDERGAIADYDAALAIDPNFGYAYATKCYSEVEIDKNDEAIRDCTRALTLNPKDAFAYRGRANAHYFSSDYAAALADANQAVNLNPNDPYAFLTRCRANFALGKLQEAQDDCSRSISLSPDDNAYFARGQIFLKTGDFADAESDLRQALKINPNYASAYYWLAVSEAQQKHVAAALTNINAYLSKHGTDPDGLMLRAVLEARQGNRGATRADALAALHQYQLANDPDGAKRAQSLLDSLSKP